MLYLLYTIEMIYEHLSKKKNNRRNIVPEGDAEQADLFYYKQVRPKIHLNSIRRQLDSIDRVVLREKEERRFEERYALKISQELNWATEMVRRKKERLERGEASFDSRSMNSMNSRMANKILNGDIVE